MAPRPSPPTTISTHEHGSARCTIYADASRREWRVGHYESGCVEDGVALLHQVTRHARSQAASSEDPGGRDARIIGPMDGTTWHKYRYVIDRDLEAEGRPRPPFLFEPAHPGRYPAEWLQAGFAPIETYVSSWCPDTSRRDPRMTRVEQRLSQADVTVRPIDRDCFDGEMAAIHKLSRIAFAPNPHYTPIDEDAFAALYADSRDRIVPQLVLLAEHERRLVGYVFTTPDVLQAERGESVDTLIVKTVAVRPGRTYAGLGQWLVERAQLAGHAMGLRHAIHALMHESNASTSLSAHYGAPFRRYALFGKPLGSAGPRP